MIVPVDIFKPQLSQSVKVDPCGEVLDSQVGQVEG